MEFAHVPVLLEECIRGLNIKPGGTYIDGTVGGAGHAAEILARLDREGTLLGIDRDGCAVEAAGKRLEALGARARVIVEKGNFSDIKQVCEKHGIGEADGILLDLGVSSYQLEEEERGFSYQRDALLDMRMDESAELTAETVINEYPEERLARVIREYGEEKWAARIASFITERRKRKRIRTTGELVDIIKAAIPAGARRSGPHPAKRTFQAVRIEVNDELGHLRKAIAPAAEMLAKGGRLCIITFHSLEDRIVKEEFLKLTKRCTCPPELPVCVCGKVPVGRIVNRKPILPSREEVENNPRARSAKLRILEKTAGEGL